MSETTIPSEQRVEDPMLQALMRRYQSGDLEAFRDLHPALNGCLRTLFRRKGLKADNVDDLVQETFLQIHRARESYDATREVKPWACGIARNVYRMHRRAAGRRYIETVDADQCVEPAASAEDLPGRAWVRDAIGRVPPERRTPLILRHIWGYSFKEIAGALGIREGTAKVRSHRAMSELRSRLVEPTQSAA